MRALQACSCSPLTKNNKCRSRASSMHLTQCLDQASAVGWLMGEITGPIEGEEELWTSRYDLPASFDHLVGPGEQRRRNFKAKRPTRLEIDDQLEFGRLHDR